MRKIKNSRGFSLFEVLVAMAVFSLGVLAVLGTFPSMLKLNQQSWEYTRDITLAQQKMTQIMEGLYGTPVPPKTYTDHPLNPRITRTWAAAAAPKDPYGNSQSNLQWVWVLITSNDGGKFHSVKLESYLAY